MSFSVQQDCSSEKLRLLPMCLPDQRLGSLGFFFVSEGVSQPQCFSFILLYVKKLGMSLTLCEVWVIKVCEMLWELPTEREVSTQKSVHSLSKLTVPMLSKTPFVLMLYRRSHISTNIIIHWCLISAGWERPRCQSTISFLLCKAKQEKFWKVFQVFTQPRKKNWVVFFQVGLWKYSLDLRKGYSAFLASPLHPWYLLTMWSGQINDLSSHWLSILIRKSTLSGWMFWCYLRFVRASFFLGDGFY